MEAKKKKQAAAIVSAAFIIAAVGGINAYFIDKDYANNTVAVGYNEQSLTEDGFSGTYAQIGKTYEVTKPAKVTNSGDIPVYVRARIELSDSALKDVVTFSYDGGSTGVKLDAYCPTGWTKENDGYYYYAQELKPNESAELLKKVFADYGEKTVTPYDIIIYTETVQVIDPKTGEKFSSKQEAFESIQAPAASSERPATIVYDPGTGSGTLTYEQLQSGKQTTVKAPSALGISNGTEEFGGWLMDGTTVIQAGDTLSYTDHPGKVVTLKAQWGSKWLVNFMNGADTAVLSEGTNPFGFMKTNPINSYTVTMPEAVLSNYTFIRWFPNAELTGATSYIAGDNVSLAELTFEDDKNSNLYAQWGGTVRTIYNDGVHDSTEEKRSNGTISYTFPGDCNDVNSSKERFAGWGIVNKGSAVEEIYTGGTQIDYALDGNTDFKALWTTAKTNEDYANTTFAEGSNDNEIWIRQNNQVYDAGSNKGYFHNYGSGARSLVTKFDEVGETAEKKINVKATFKWGNSDANNSGAETNIYFGTELKSSSSAFCITVKDQKIYIGENECGSVSGDRLNAYSYSVEFWLDTTSKEVNWTVTNGDNTYTGTQTAAATSINGIYANIGRGKAYGLSDFSIIEI